MTFSPKEVKKCKILIMDDNPHILSVLHKILTNMGHTVDVVKEGDGAIDKYKLALENGTPFDLLFIDLTIKGGRGGKSTMEELLKIDPGVRAIVSSGYTGDPVIDEYYKYGFIDFLVKPYKLDDFIAKIEKHL
ncbi:MAG: response regulator [Spirochaetales bacterium]|nr:response regulator [Spirochaetales bacterium]